MIVVKLFSRGYELENLPQGGEFVSLFVNEKGSESRFLYVPRASINENIMSADRAYFLKVNGKGYDSIPYCYRLKNKKGIGEPPSFMLDDFVWGESNIVKYLKKSGNMGLFGNWFEGVFNLNDNLNEKRKSETDINIDVRNL
jgi:hypothetical protein